MLMYNSMEFIKLIGKTIKYSARPDIVSIFQNLINKFNNT